MKLILLLITILLVEEFTFSQSPYTNILIDNNSTAGFYPNEPSICINPKNTNIVVAGSIISSFYYSSNGGANWTEGTLASNPYGVWGDPTIIVDTNQVFYYFHLSNPSSGGSWIDRIVCQRSTNNGVNWNNPGSYTWLNPPKEQDKQWAAVDFTHGPRGNWIYVTWTEFDSYGSTNTLDSSRILFARSTNGGNNWVGVTRINTLGGDCVDQDYTTEGAVPAVGPNGEIYVAWSGPLGINNFKIFFDKSTDGGNTWLASDIVAANQRGGWDYIVSQIYRSNGLPVTCCDVSNGPNRGTIYVNYTDSAGTNDHDVMLIKSTNGGVNWSSPIRVNDDAPGKEQFFTWMTIDQATGYLYTVFYDRRNYTDTQTDVFMARSTNGGTTWINERISSSPFIPVGSVFFGDYTNISAHNGKVRPIWARLSGGTMSIWTAIIDLPIGIEPEENETPKDFNLRQNYPNPFNPGTEFKFDIPEDADVKLFVYNALGKEVAEIINTNLRAGSYSYHWDASELSSGIYFYTLSSGEFIQSRKMILIK